MKIKKLHSFKTSTNTYRNTCANISSREINSTNHSNFSKQVSFNLKSSNYSLDKSSISLKRKVSLRNNKRNILSQSLNVSDIKNSSSNFSSIKGLSFNNLHKISGEFSKEDISKKNLECDIQITSLKKKLANIKKQRKESENNVKLMKHRILNLQRKEKESIRDLEVIKQYVERIKNNRKKIKSKFNIKKFSCRSPVNNFTFKNYNTFNFSVNNNESISNSKIFSQNKQISLKGANNCSKKRKIIPKYNNSTIKDKSINFENFNISNSNSYSNKIKNVNNNITEQNNITSFNFEDNNIQNQKQNLIYNLNKDEEEKKRIEIELERIEKEQYNLLLNFNENMNNNQNDYRKNSKNIILSNKINSNNNIFRKDTNSTRIYMQNLDEEDNILNYNF